jgi:uncharacterized radical SAM superfamily Fe-S cluster-containing enzyme
MNELQLLKEQWSEQMFEARANGIETESFEDWNHKRMARMEFFESFEAEREATKKANDDARMEFFNEWKNAESDPESIAEALAS